MSFAMEDPLASGTYRIVNRQYNHAVRIDDDRPSVVSTSTPTDDEKWEITKLPGSTPTWSIARQINGTLQFAVPSSRPQLVRLLVVQPQAEQVEWIISRSPTDTDNTASYYRIHRQDSGIERQWVLTKDKPGIGLVVAKGQDFYWKFQLVNPSEPTGTTPAATGPTEPTPGPTGATPTPSTTGAPTPTSFTTGAPTPRSHIYTTPTPSTTGAPTPSSHYIYTTPTRSTTSAPTPSSHNLYTNPIHQTTGSTPTGHNIYSPTRTTGQVSRGRGSDNDNDNDDDDIGIRIVGTGGGVRRFWQADNGSIYTRGWYPNGTPWGRKVIVPGRFVRKPTPLDALCWGGKKGFDQIRLYYVDKKNFLQEMFKPNQSYWRAGKLGSLKLRVSRRSGTKLKAKRIEGGRVKVRFRSMRGVRRCATEVRNWRVVI